MTVFKTFSEVALLNPNMTKADNASSGTDCAIGIVDKDSTPCFFSLSCNSKIKRCAVLGPIPFIC
ncbi:hypothetical protein D3C78_1793960 [compost metagenome]